MDLYVHLYAERSSVLKYDAVRWVFNRNADMIEIEYRAQGRLAMSYIPKANVVRIEEDHGPLPQTLDGCDLTNVAAFQPPAAKPVDQPEAPPPAA